MKNEPKDVLQQFLSAELAAQLESKQEGRTALAVLSRALDEGGQRHQATESALVAANQRVIELETTLAQLRQMPAKSPVVAASVDLTPLLEGLALLAARLGALEQQAAARSSAPRQLVFEVVKDGAGLTRQIIAKEA